MEQALVDRLSGRAGQIEGYVTGYLYRLDDGPATDLLAVVFASKDAYVANAQSPAQQEHDL